MVSGSHSYLRSARRRLCLAVMTACLLLAACLGTPPPTAIPPPVEASPSPSASAAAQASPTSSPSTTLSPSPSPSATLFPDPSLPVWQHFAGPNQTAVTAIPYPMAGLNLPPQVKVALLAGLDTASPVVGRTDAIQLVFYNPDTAHASLVSLPPDLLVYLPGQTMQRLNIAYALGDVDLLLAAIQYNFGVNPTSWAVFHTDSFGRMVDAMGGVDVPVSVKILDACGGIRPGTVHMDGQTALCYVRLRKFSDEASRNQRELEVVRQVFLKMTGSGNLAHLASLYNLISPSLQTNLSLNDMAALVPVALEMGDSSHIAAFYPDSHELKAWMFPGPVASQVFLPRRNAMRALLQDAIDFVLAPAPASNMAKTLAAQITRSPTVTLTFTSTSTPYPTITITRTPSKTWTGTPAHRRKPTLSRTPTRRPTATKTSTPTSTFTPTSTPTPTPSLTPTS